MRVRKCRLARCDMPRARTSAGPSRRTGACGAQAERRGAFRAAECVIETCGSMTGESRQPRRGGAVGKYGRSAPRALTVCEPSSVRTRTLAANAASTERRALPAAATGVRARESGRVANRPANGLAWRTHATVSRLAVTGATDPVSRWSPPRSLATVALDAATSLVSARRSRDAKRALGAGAIA